MTFYDQHALNRLGSPVRYFTIRSLLLLTYSIGLLSLANVAKDRQSLVWMVCGSIPLALALAWLVAHATTRSRNTFAIKFAATFALIQGIAISIAAVFLVKQSVDGDPLGFMAAPFALFPAFAGILSLRGALYLVNVIELNIDE